jgi:hypothetical protein
MILNSAGHSITSSTVLSFSVFVLVPPPYCMLGFLFSFENKVVSLSKLILFSNANRSLKAVNLQLLLYHWLILF